MTDPNIKNAAEMFWFVGIDYQLHMLHDKMVLVSNIHVNTDYSFFTR